MALKSILIVTAGFGEGHNAAARNLANAIRAAHPECAVEVHDIFLEAYGWVNRLTQKGYIFTINHLPWAWEIVFQILDRTPVVGNGIGIFRRAARLLEDTIARMKPQAIVSTYPGYGHLLDHVNRHASRQRIPLVTVVTDSLTINTVWHRCHTDLFLVANDATRDVMIAQGVEPERVKVTGFPVPLIFAEPPPERPIPSAGRGRWKVLYMVNSAHHTAASIVSELLTLEDVDLTVTVGRDADLEKSLSRLAESQGRSITLYGWTPEIPRLIRESHLLISKAGGATVQEAMAAGTPMVITQIVPGQEEGNARLLIENNAGQLATTPPAIRAAVAAHFAEEGALYRERLAAARALGHPTGAAASSAAIENLISV